MTLLSPEDAQEALITLEEYHAKIAELIGNKEAAIEYILNLFKDENAIRPCDEAVNDAQKEQIKQIQSFLETWHKLGEKMYMGYLQEEPFSAPPASKVNSVTSTPTKRQRRGVDDPLSCPARIEHGARDDSSTERQMTPSSVLGESLYKLALFSPQSNPHASNPSPIGDRMKENEGSQELPRVGRSQVEPMQPRSLKQTLELIDLNPLDTPQI